MACQSFGMELARTMFYDVLINFCIHNVIDFYEVLINFLRVRTFLEFLDKGKLIFCR